MKGVKKTDLLTFYGNPDIKIRSEYGLISTLEWCKRECERINRINKNAVVHFNELGNVAIVNMKGELC